MSGPFDFDCPWCGHEKHVKVRMLCVGENDDATADVYRCPACERERSIPKRPPAGFTTKDSGERVEFAGGMKRDTNAGKTLWHLVAAGPLLKRWAELLTRGAQKYDANNWMKADGPEELERFRESAFRHFMQWYLGDTDEDHAAAVVFNLNGACYVQDRLKAKESALMTRKRIYLAGPISKGDLLVNVNQATDAFIKLAKAGLAPFCPHWSVYSKPAARVGRDVFCRATSEGNANLSHDDWLGIDLAWVAVADALLRLPGESVGADREVAEADRLGIPVFHDADWLIDRMAPKVIIAEAA